MVEVRGAFDDVENISAVPTPFTPACDGRQLAPIAGPIIVRGADVGSAPDSLLEQRGFEPSVPP